MKVWIKVQAGARENRIVGRREDGVIKIKIRAKREKGEANRELIKYLCEYLGVKRGDIKIIRGSTSSLKLLEIKGVEKFKI